MAEALKIREMESADLDAVRPLLSQLGYELSEEEVARRFSTVAADPSHIAWVAKHDSQIVGFLHAFVRPALEKPPEIVVQAMVVNDEVRGQGVGRALMDRAERWASDSGFETISLSSQIDRKGAHAFYARLGFETAATSNLLRKRIAAP